MPLNTFANRTSSLPLSELDANFTFVSDSTNLSFLQSGTGAVSRSVQAKERDIVSVKDFGAVGDGTTDDTAEIQAAINSITTSGAIYFPAGTYLISALLTVASTQVVYLIGAGPRSTTIKQSSATLGGLQFTVNYGLGGGVTGMSIKGNSTTGTGSTGIGLYVTNCNDNFVIQDVEIKNFDKGIRFDACFNANVTNFVVRYFADYGVYLASGTAGADNQFTNGVISNNSFTGTNTNSIGLWIQASGGDHFKSIGITSSNKGVVVNPPAASQVLYLFFDGVVADTTTNECWLLDGTQTVWSIYAVNCWGAYSTSGSGLITKGANLVDVNFVASRFRENGLRGWHHQGGDRVYLTGCAVAANSKSSANTYDGVLIDADVSGWGIDGGAIGNYASAFTQNYGIKIAAGNSENFLIRGVDLRNNTAGPINNGANGVNYQILGNLPKITSSTNASQQSFFSGSSVSTVAAGATAYLGCNSQQSSVGVAPFTIGQAGLITALQVTVNAAPGVGKNYTYTVYKNGSATAITGTISGAASFSLYTGANIFTVAIGDYIEVQVVTDAASAVTIHKFVMMFQP